MQIEGATLIKVEESDIPQNGLFEIPQGVTRIAQSAFSGNQKLIAVTLNESLTKIGNYAFFGCTNLASVTFNKNLTKIGGWVFQGCKSLTTVTFNESLVQIGGWAFHNCTGLTAVAFNKNLKIICVEAFSRTGLTSVTFNESLALVGREAFTHCIGLTTVNFNKNLTEIRFAAFYGCTNLTSVIFNEQLTQIDIKAFAGCTSLKKIIIDTEDDANFIHITNLLPEKLRGICIKKSFHEQLEAIKATTLTEILKEPATNPLRRTTKNATFTRDIWQLLNLLGIDSNKFYQKAKHMMDALPWPQSNDEIALAQYSEECKKICSDCLDIARRTICERPLSDSASARFFTNKNDKEGSAEEQSLPSEKDKGPKQ